MDLSHSKINDEGLAALTQILLHKSTLKKLCLRGSDLVTFIGWETLFSSLKDPKTTLEQLDIKANSINDQAAAALAESLRTNITLKLLNLNCNENIGSIGWRRLFSVLGEPNSALVELNVYGNKFEDAEIAVLARGLVNNQTLRSLDLSENFEVSSRGWLAFFNSLRGSKCSLQYIELSDNYIDDDGAVALAALLDSMSPPKTLYLQCIESITTAGWQALSHHLQSEDCQLTHLSLGPDDNAANTLSEAFVHNRSVLVLFLGSEILDSTAFDVQWDAFSKALCDKSSIDATHSSNHVLIELFDTDTNDADIPGDISFLLQLNRNNTKSGAARAKILHYHFLNKDVPEVECFIAMDLKILPIAISWIGKDSVGFPVLNQVFKTMPNLCGSNKNVDSIGLKRKRT